MFNVTLDGVKWENPLLTVFFPHLLYINSNLMFISPNLLVFCFINWRKDEGGVFLWKHLLDFVRASLILPGHPDHMHYNNPSHVIHCVSKLRQAGIKLKPEKATSFLVIKFSHGVLEMPSITMDDFMGSFLINCVAYAGCCPENVTESSHERITEDNLLIMIK